MHELATAQILSVAGGTGDKSPVQQGKARVWLEIGVMACVEVPALHFGFGRRRSSYPC